MIQCNFKKTKDIEKGILNTKKIGEKHYCLLAQDEGGGYSRWLDIICVEENCIFQKILSQTYQK